MSIPARVRDHLRQSGGKYKARVCPGAAGTFSEALACAELPPSKVARATLVKADQLRLMIIHPADQEVDLAALEQLFKRHFQFACEAELKAVFPDCDHRALPPLPQPYGVRALVDPRLVGLQEVFFSLGRLGTFVRTDRETFRKLTAEAWQRTAAREPGSAGPADERLSIADMKEQVQRLNELPPMPGIAAQVLRLRENPYAHISELAAIIEQDPSLSAQIIRYASSPFYGYQGKVDSVAMAIARVLGMDFVLDLAFGLSLGKSFRNPPGGPLGLDAFWKHATHAAALTQALCNQIEYLNRPSPGFSYLAGLLHNFGILLLGHLFPEQFRQLNDAVVQQPGRAIIEIEREILGTTHTELGIWLAEAWNMPVEIAGAIREHHNPQFDGEYSTYPNLVYLANALLKQHQIGDADSDILPLELLSRLGIDETAARAALDSVIDSRETLDFIAHRMAA